MPPIRRAFPARREYGSNRLPSKTSTCRAVSTWRAALLIAIYLAAAAAFLFGAVRQRASLNLSATAGGQHPYLEYAEGIALEGITRFVGDRNRMPAVPALVSVVYDADRQRFVERASAMSIALVVAVVIGVGVIPHRILRPLSACAVTLAAAFGVFLDKASFVQAEWLYYGLFFLSWWLAVRLVRRPTPGRGAWCGLALAAAQMTKASALPLLASTVVFVLIGCLIGSGRKRGPGSPGAWTGVFSGALAVIVFAAVCAPYLAENKSRFGRIFYNVNSTFFMWCDSWREAAGFADAHELGKEYPDAPAEEIPGPITYWETHTGRQILARVRYGLTVLAEETFAKRFGAYLAMAGVACGLAMLVGGRRRVRFMLADSRDRLVPVFCAVTFAGYLLSYAWYVPVAYGDRFVQSLFLPVMCGAVFVMERSAGARRGRPRMRRADALAALMIAVVLLDGVLLAAPSADDPPPHFVEFYYNESVERERAGDAMEARRGYEGVHTIDPTFIPRLGRAALEAGRFDAAVAHLGRAASVDRNPIVLNDLGSALVQSGRGAEAVEVLREATERDPEFAVAWFNLGGTLIQLDRTDEASEVIDRLAELDPRLARTLNDLMPRPTP